jgi:M6 family metalloprotease-like protein
LCAIVPPDAAAQGRRHPRWEIPGFDFRKDGVLRTRARKVREARARLLAAGQFDALNAPLARAKQGGPQPSPTSTTTLTGVLKVPAILFRYKDSPAPPFTTANYNEVLFGATPTGAAAGRPYTYRSFYNQMSNGVFDIQGNTFGYANLDSNEVYYTGGTSATCQAGNPYGSPNCNGLFSGLAVTRMQDALTKSLDKLDASIDFSQFVDTASGFVPLVLFMHQAMGGECGPSSLPENHLWAHRFALSTYTTQDDWPGHPGEKVKISDYILQSGVGGANSCTPSQIMPIGTIAHETGHGFGLPDLYDTGGQTEGIGQWGLMSSGSFTSPNSPSRMEAWSLNELGWVMLVPADTTGTYSFDAAPLSDIAYYVPVQGTNTRREYYLLENRQRQQSDSALIRIHCAWSGNPPGCGGGLLIWHVDSTKLLQGAFSNTVNFGSIHGLAVVQADAFRNLDASPGGTRCDVGTVFNGCSDRGDAGDVYPGTAGNTAMVFRTNPAALKNLDGSFAGFAVDSIRQLVTDRTMSFRIRFGALTVVRASDTAATIQFDAAPFKVFRDLLEEGSSHTVGFTDPQLSANGRTRWHLASWSDGGAASHPITGSLSGDTLIANLAREFKLIATSGAGGSIQSDTAIDLSGTFIPQGRAVTLTATADPGVSFGGWCGDTLTVNPVVELPMQRPYTVVASFGDLSIASMTARSNGVMGAAYADTLRTGGGPCASTWTVTGGALPNGLTLDGPTGVVSGFPRQTGNFTYTATVTSGAQSQGKTFTFSVTAPTLATADVTAQLLGPTAPLNPDQIRYLDFLGNGNIIFDIGDFLAWVKATGAPLSAAALQAVQRKGGPR